MVGHRIEKTQVFRDKVFGVHPLHVLLLLTWPLCNLWIPELAGALSLNEGEDVSLVRYTQEGDSNDNGGNLQTFFLPFFPCRLLGLFSFSFLELCRSQSRCSSSLNQTVLGQSENVLQPSHELLQDDEGYGERPSYTWVEDMAFFVALIYHQNDQLYLPFFPLFLFWIPRQWLQKKCYFLMCLVKFT